MYVCGHVLASRMSGFIFSLVALLQVEVSARHPPPAPPFPAFLIAYCAKYLSAAKQLSGSHSPSPVSTATSIQPGRQTTLPAHPLIQQTQYKKTTNTPTKLFPHGGLVRLISAESIKTPSGVKFRGGRDCRSCVGVTWFSNKINLDLQYISIGCFFFYSFS